MNLSNFNIVPFIFSVLISNIISNSQIHCQVLDLDNVSFVFKNTKTLDEDELESAVALSSSDHFSSKVLNEDLYRLKKFYFDNGFFDARIDTAVSYNLQDNEADVRFIISENKRFRIDSVHFIGLEKISPDALRLFNEIEKIKPGDFYNKSRIVKNTNSILNMLHNNGYMNARLNEDSGTVVQKYDYSPETILSVTLNFEGADSLFYFGKTDINIIDNKYGVPEELLYKQIEYSEGELYSEEKKLTSERDISKISIVQSTRIKIDNIEQGSRVNFIADVTLNKKHEVRPALQATNIENSFYIGADVMYFNRYFPGDGSSLALELDALYNSIPLNRFELSAAITDPNLFNKRSLLIDRITLGLFNRQDAQNYYLGNLTSLQYYFAEHTFYNYGTLDLNEEIVRYIYIDTTAPPITLLNSMLSTTFTHDRTNNAFSPTNGVFHSITVGHAGLLSRLIVNEFAKDWYYSQYFEVGTTNKFFHTLFSPSTVFATKFIIGDNIQYGSGERQVTVQSLYRYFSGGSNSLRGWYAKQNGMLYNTVNGGNFLVEGSFEIRQKLFPRAQSFTKNIAAGYFFDYGNVWEDDQDFRYDQIALAVGFGLRYDLVIGPIRFDFGFKLYDPRSADDEKWLFDNWSIIFTDKFAFHFAIGEAF